MISAMSNIEKLGSYLGMTYSCGIQWSVTQDTILELQYAYNKFNLTQLKHIVTLNQEAARIYASLGFSVRMHGAGWEITV